MVVRRVFGKVLAVFAASAVGFVASSAEAQAYRDGPPPEQRIVYRDLTLFRWNPLGLISDARITYRHRLYESQSLAFRDNFLGVGIAPALSGAFLRGGPMLEFQPASFIQFWGIYEFIGYFGAFNFLQSYPTANAAKVNYSDTELDRRGDLAAGDPEKNYSATGTQLMYGANLQFKFGSIVVRDQIRFGRARMNLRQGDRVYYDIFYDLLTGNRGDWMANDADVLYQALDNRLTIGLRYSMGKAFYLPEHFAPGEDTNSAPESIHRAGPLVAWTFKQPDGAALEPTVLLVMNWWLKSPYRTGQDVSQGVPYIVAALNITGDLLPTKKPAAVTPEVISPPLPKAEPVKEVAPPDEPVDDTPPNHKKHKKSRHKKRPAETELPKDAAPPAEPPKNTPAKDATPPVEPPKDAPPKDATPPVEPPKDATPPVEPPKEKPPTDAPIAPPAAPNETAPAPAPAPNPTTPTPT